MIPNKPHEFCSVKGRSVACGARLMLHGRCDTHGRLAPRGSASPTLTHDRSSIAAGAVPSSGAALDSSLEPAVWRERRPRRLRSSEAIRTAPVVLAMR